MTDRYEDLLGDFQGPGVKQSLKETTGEVRVHNYLTTQ